MMSKKAVSGVLLVIMIVAIAAFLFSTLGTHANNSAKNSTNKTQSNAASNIIAANQNSNVSNTNTLNTTLTNTTTGTTTPNTTITHNTTMPNQNASNTSNANLTNYNATNANTISANVTATNSTIPQNSTANTTASTAQTSPSSSRSSGISQGSQSTASGATLTGRCVAGYGYFCANITFDTTTENLTLTVGQGTGIDWTSANVAFVNQSDQGNVTMNGSIYGMPYAYIPNGIASGNTVTVSIHVPSVNTASTQLSGYIWANYTVAAMSGTVLTTQIAYTNLSK